MKPLTHLLLLCALRAFGERERRSERRQAYRNCEECASLFALSGHWSRLRSNADIAVILDRETVSETILPKQCVLPKRFPREQYHRNNTGDFTGESPVEIRETAPLGRNRSAD